MKLSLTSVFSNGSILAHCEYLKLNTNNLLTRFPFLFLTHSSCSLDTKGFAAPLLVWRCFNYVLMSTHPLFLSRVKLTKEGSMLQSCAY